MKKYIGFLIAAAVLVVVVLAGLAIIRSRGNQELTSDAEVSEQSTPAVQSVVTLEEFGDYQCPPCAQLHPALKSLKKELGPNLNFVFRNLPLSTIHKNALAAAQAAEAARMQNRFWEMHDLLYENQSLWAEERDPKSHFRRFAEDLGLDTVRFETDMKSDQVRFRLEADQDAAVRLGIDGTPTVLINGRQVRPEATNAEGIRKGIEASRSGK
ncbi:MAG TPA: thioredoxin domain-containing protein [Pyrinomonadaceae bacterium]|nr:thioredoxin domain-containing protein [Pyrinomonadaceae bacterium]